MFKSFLKTLLIILSIFPLFACSNKANVDDFDLSNIKLPKKKVTNITKDLTKNDLQTKATKNRLKPLAEKNEILARVKFGKKDPFSRENNDENGILPNLVLKGFVSFNNEDYAHIVFKNQSGFVSVNSVGDLNTKLLPKNAFVKDINPSKDEIKISIEKVVYTINLSI